MLSEVYMWEYSSKVRDLFLNPKNSGVIENPDGIGEIGNIVCGDALKLTLRVDKNTNKITDAKFQTFGCASAIASSSALTEMIKGKTIDEALKVTNHDIAEYLGGLPREKMHCSVMGQEALAAAIADYRGVKIPEPEEGEIVCKCFEVTDKKIRRTIKENNLKSVEDITNFTKAGGGCGDCIPEIEKILEDTRAEKDGDTVFKPERKKLTNIQKIALIQDIIEKDIRPGLQSHGGDVELIDIDGSSVILSLRSMCAGCLMSHVTIREIEKKLRELVSPELTVKTE